MNRLITDFASPTAGQPIVADNGVGTLPFIQDGIQEALFNLFKAILYSYTTDDVIILDGLVFTLTNSGNTNTWTAGAIGYNGEIYTVAAGAVTKTGGQAFVFKNIETYSALDPVIFKDLTSHSVHQIRRITIQAGTTGSGIADYNGATVKRKIKTKIIPIGDWNMVSDSSVDVAHGLSSSNFLKIKEIEVIIINDGGDKLYNILKNYGAGVVGGGVFEINSTDVTLSRSASINGGFFDDTDFDSHPYNRGYISIKYGDI